MVQVFDKKIKPPLQVSVIIIYINLSISVKSMWNTAVGIKNCKQLFSLRVAFTTQKKSNTCSGDDVRRMCCYFLGCKCKQWWEKLFTVFDTDWVRAGGEGGVSHSLNLQGSRYLIFYFFFRSFNRSKFQFRDAIKIQKTSAI